MAGLLGLLLSFLIVFLVERFVPIPSALRLLILLAGTSAAVGFAPLWVRRWVFGHRREEQLARLISQKFPALGDRLLGVIELQDQDALKENLSPELREAALAHVAAQAAKRDMDEALPNSWARRLVLAASLAALATLIGVGLSPKAGGNAFKRWLLPFSETTHYTFTRFDMDRVPDPKIVPLGEAFTFELPLLEGSDQRPATAQARYGQQDWIQASLGQDGIYRFEFPGQQEKNFLTFRAGDALERTRVEPEIRPETTRFEALVDLPDYLQLPPRTIDIRTGSLVALEGSEIQLRGTFTRPIAEAKAILTELPPDLVAGEAPKPDLQLAQPVPLNLSYQESQIISEPFTITSPRARIPFEWEDLKGLRGDRPFEVRIETTQDETPLSYIQGVSRSVAILAEETVQFEALNEDDYGLKEIGIVWQGQEVVNADGGLLEGEMVLKLGTPSSTRLQDQILFSPLTHDISPQRITLRAYAQDYRPGSQRTYSKPITVYVLTRDEHAQIVKARFDRIINELEDLARQEQNDFDQNKRLEQRHSGEELQEAEKQKELAEAEERERKNIEKMKELSKRMEKVFEDAIRNESLDTKTMKQLNETMEDMKELAEQDMPQTQEKLEETQSQRSTGEKTKKDLQEALEKQKAALEKMKETAEKANKANQNFEASTFVNRLKKAASDEKLISDELKKALSPITTDGEEVYLLGLTRTAEKMDPLHSRLLRRISSQQRRNNIDIRWIQEDLTKFYARTKKPEHKELIDAMSSTNIDSELEQLLQKIDKNHSFTSTRVSKKWADQLAEWAGSLAGDQNGGGGGGGGGSQENEDFEFMLKVLRMVQAEQDIRSRTRSLEQLLRSLKLRTTKKLTPALK